MFPLPTKFRKYQDLHISRSQEYVYKEIARPRFFPHAHWAASRPLSRQ